MTTLYRLCRTSRRVLSAAVIQGPAADFVSCAALRRCLIRYLKHHGTDYAFDAATWAHYRRERLNKMQLFKVTGWGDRQT